MIGCGLIWGACALALVAVIKHRRFGCHRGGYGYGGYGGGCGDGGGGGDWHGHDGWGGGHGHFRRGFGGFGFRAVVRSLFERLGTGPGQEKAILAALDDLKAAMGGAREELKGTRKDFADAFRRGPIDEAAVADIFVRHDTVISETRRKAVDAVGRIHEALDDTQREEVADLLEHGFGPPWRARGGRGYRR